MNKFLTIVLALQLAGCATARTLNAAKPGAPVVYAGTRLDLYAMNGGCCAMDRFGAEAPSYPGLDLPASAVLDTLLLSAVVHPNQESHKLDVILERLGITIGTRHNALEDALATGEVFLKLVKLLEDMGIVTVRQALEASEKTYFARVKY